MTFLDKIDQILTDNYMDSTFDYPTLCLLLNWSRSKVYRRFQEENLGSPSAYIRNFRLHKAQELLKQTELIITEIAYQVGYISSAHFTENFSKTFKTPPTLLRKDWKNSN